MKHSVEWPLERACIRPAAESASSSFPSDSGEHQDGASDSDAMRSLCRAKESVPATRRECGEKRWRFIVDTKGSPVCRPGEFKMASRAYLKMAEIMATCALPPPRVSVHLCEAPGGFVQAVSRAAEPGWRWVALSLPGPPHPATECLAPLSKSGTFVTADVNDFDACLEAVSSALSIPLAEHGHCANEEDSRRGCACLVTADGAVEMDHSDLERTHFPLLVAQTTLGLRLLSLGGTLVVKFFEGARIETVHWIARLTTLFRGGVSLIKPTSSRPTNSERYLVARDFSPGIEITRDFLTRPCVVADGWLASTRHVLDRMAIEQEKALRSALLAARHS